MTPEEREFLQRSVKIGEENNKLLRSIHRSLQISRIISLVYWVFIIGSAVGAYYLIQPYIDSITSAYGGAKDSFNGLGDLFNNL